MSVLHAPAGTLPGGYSKIIAPKAKNFQFTNKSLNLRKLNNKISPTDLDFLVKSPGSWYTKVIICQESGALSQDLFPSTEALTESLSSLYGQDNSRENSDPLTLLARDDWI